MRKTRLRKIGKATNWRKKCVVWAKLEARKRDNDTCQYCGVTRKSGASIHGSHVLPEGAYPLMSAEPYNIIALCAVHHLAGANPRMGNKSPSWHGDPLYFAEWFEKKWPGRYKKLREMDREKQRHIVDWQGAWKAIKERSHA